MKAIIGLLCVLLIGCAAGKIPKYPTFKQVGVYPIENGICVDNKNLKVWLDNITLLQRVARTLREGGLS